MQRRNILQGISALSLAPTWGALAALLPAAAHARITAAFEARSNQTALDALYPESRIEESDLITINAPDIVENGAVVPLTIQSSLADIESLAIFAPDNPLPLAAVFQFSPQTALPINFRLKLGQSQDVLIVVKAGGRLYSATRMIFVTIGGCSV